MEVIMNEVYLIINNINNKKYVGVTHRGYLKRYHEHLRCAKNGRKSVLYDAMRKYGIQNFSVCLIESNISDDEIQAKERYYIEYYNSIYINRNGYNMTVGGMGMAGYRHTDRAKQKIGAKSKGRKFSSERNEKIRQAMIGREYKPEWRKSLSECRYKKCKFGLQHVLPAAQ
jgi:group I intron endonuclease